MSINVGGFSPFASPLTPEAKKSFDQAMKGLVGVNYEPIAFASQVVAGLNYAFFCNATVVAPGASTYPAMVNVFQPLEGNASVTHIQRLDY